LVEIRVVVVRGPVGGPARISQTLRVLPLPHGTAALDHEVLEEMSEAGTSRRLVTKADSIMHTHGGSGCPRGRYHQDPEPVAQNSPSDVPRRTHTVTHDVVPKSVSRRLTRRRTWLRSIGQEPQKVRSLSELDLVPADKGEEVVQVQSDPEDRHPVQCRPRVTAVTVDDGGDQGPPGRIARLGAGTPLELQQFSDDPADVPGGRTHRDVLTGQDFRTAGLR